MKKKLLREAIDIVSPIICFDELLSNALYAVSRMVTIVFFFLSMLQKVKSQKYRT